MSRVCPSCGRRYRRWKRTCNHHGIYSVALTGSGELGMSQPDYEVTLRRVTVALDDCIKCACNGGFGDNNGWEQDAYNEWDAARTEAEALLGIEND